MADTDKQVTDDKPVEEVSVEEPGVEGPQTEPVVGSPTEAVPEVEETPKVEEPVSSPTVPTDDAATPAGTDQLGRQLYDAKCAKCGKQAQVPFKPSGDRPVYCRDCYMEQRRG